MDVPLCFVYTLQVHVLALVGYLAALLLFIPMNVAVLPFSFCSDIPLAALDAAIDDVRGRTRDLFQEKFNINTWIH